MSSLLYDFASALLLTIAIELAVVALLGGRTARELAAVALVNVITNPPLTLALMVLRLFALPAMSADAAQIVQFAFIALAELAIVIIEWRLLTWALRADSGTWLFRSAVMNAASLVLGSWLLVVAQQALAR